MNVEEKLIYIAEREIQVYQAGQNNIILTSPYLIGFASGTDISLNDVAPLNREFEIFIKSKNKVVYPYQDADKTINGITIEVYPDGSINFNGTATASTNFNIVTSSGIIPWDVMPRNYVNNEPNIYTASLRYEGEYSGTIVWYISYYPVGPNTYQSWLQAKPGEEKTDYAPIDMKGIRSYINFSSGAKVDNLRLFPQLELNEKATEWTIYTDSFENMPPIVVTATDSDGSVQTAIADYATGKVNGIYSRTKSMDFSTNFDNLVLEINYRRT